MKAGVLIGVLALFFLKRYLGGGISHPDLYVRLKVIIGSLFLDELDNLWESQVWPLAYEVMNWV